MLHKIPLERCCTRFLWKDVAQDASALQDSSKDVSQDASQDFSKGIFAKQSYNVSYEVSA
jgi:hypothetical protein